MKRIGILLLLFTTSLMGCESMEESKDLGEKFFTSVKAGKFDEVVPMLHPEAIAATPAADWLALLRNTQAQFGNLKSYSSNAFKTNTDNGTNITRLKYKTEYDRKVLYTMLTFKSAEGTAPQILSYEYNEDESAISSKMDEE